MTVTQSVSHMRGVKKCAARCKVAIRSIFRRRYTGADEDDSGADFNGDDDESVTMVT